MSDQIQTTGKKDEGAALPPRAPLPPLLRYLPRLSGPMIGLLALFGLFVVLLISQGGIWHFVSQSNLQQLMHANAIEAVVALGMLLVIISGGIDLSVGAVAGLSAVMTVNIYLFVLERTASPGLAAVGGVVGGVVVGSLCGLVNGLAVIKLRVTPFVSTLGMLSLAHGLALWLAGGRTISLGLEQPEWVTALRKQGSDWFFFDPGVWSAVVLAVVTALLLRFTVFGRYCYAIGSNEATARLCGVNVERTKVMIYVLAGLLTGWAGVLAFAQSGASGDADVVKGLELTVIAAVVVGGASLTGGQGTVFGAMLGVLILGVLENGVNQCGFPVELKFILIGVIVVVNTALSQWSRRRTE